MLAALEPTLVRNAADPVQTGAARRIEKARLSTLARSMKLVMQTPEGRHVLGAILRTCGVNRSVYDNVAMKMSYNGGRQDVGHELLADLLSVGPELYDVMQQEYRASLAREASEAAAATTKSRSESED